MVPVGIQSSYPALSISSLLIIFFAGGPPNFVLDSIQPTRVQTPRTYPMISSPDGRFGPFPCYPIIELSGGLLWVATLGRQA